VLSMCHKAENRRPDRKGPAALALRLQYIYGNASHIVGYT